MTNRAEVMNQREIIDEHERRARRTVQLAVALILFVAVIYGVTFLKLPVWLPVLK